MKRPLSNAQKLKNSKYMFDLRMSAVKALGSKCKLCSITEPALLEIDHKQGDGYSERAVKSLYMIYKHIKQGKNHERYFLLCGNCHKKITYERGERARRRIPPNTTFGRQKLFGD